MAAPLSRTLRHLVAHPEIPRKTHTHHFLYYRKDDSEDISGLVKLCQQVDGILVFGTWENPVFSIAKAYNQAARVCCRDAIAFLDGDVVFHPRMLKLANNVLNNDAAMVTEVGRSVLRPRSKLLVPPYDALWTSDFQGKLKFRKHGIGNIIVPRHIVNKLRGYDERYYGWGAIDSDFFDRVKRVYQVRRTINRLPLSVHIMHPQNPTKHTECTQRNRKLWRKGGPPVRNPGGWGGAK